MQGVQEMCVRSLDQEDPLEEGMATHSGILVWRILWTEEPGGLWCMGLQRVGHDLANEQQSTSVWVFSRHFLICRNCLLVLALPHSRRSCLYVAINLVCLREEVSLGSSHVKFALEFSNTSL